MSCGFYVNIHIGVRAALRGRGYETRYTEETQRLSQVHTRRWSALYVVKKTGYAVETQVLCKRHFAPPVTLLAHRTIFLPLLSLP